MAKDDPHFRLRLPPDLKRKISISARLNNRSINSEIVAALESVYPGASLEQLADLLEYVANEGLFENEELRPELLKVAKDFKRLLDATESPPLQPDH